MAMKARRRAVDRMPVGGFGRFLLSGAFNTLASYAAYLVLVRYFSHVVAYTAAYAAGVALAYVLYRYFVYEVSAGPWGAARLIMVYGLQYAAGAGCVVLWVSLGGEGGLAPLFALVVTIPLMYFLSRLIFHGDKSR